MGSENRSDERLGGVVGPLDEEGEFCEVRATDLIPESNGEVGCGVVIPKYEPESKPPVRHREGVGDGETIGRRWERGSESVDGVALNLGEEPAVGALDLRDVGRTFGASRGNEGGTESWRDLTAFRGEASDVGFTDFWVGTGAVLDFGFFVRRLVMSDLPCKLSGSENMEVLGCTGRDGFSSITSDWANWIHNESRSSADVE